MTDRRTPPRQIRPKRWALFGTAAATGLAAAMGASGPQGPGTGSVSALLAAQASEAGEAGEAGEGAVATENAEVGFLVHLGMFEATHRIVAALYAEDRTALAQQHLEASHHAYYEDIADGVTAFGATGFEDLSSAFADAVMSGAPKEEVAALAGSVLSAIDRIHDEVDMDTADEIEAMHLLVATAAGDFEAGVDAGRVIEPQEYRDAWGFARVAQARATALATSDDAGRAKAAGEVLERLEPVWAMFPGLDAADAGSDPSILHGAAAWIEMTALKAK